MLSILYEDNHLIAVNKRAGDLVQGDETGDEPLSEKVKQYIQQKYQKPGAAFLGVVHRLDRPVSGVVIFARTSKALERMNALFQKRETRKTYWAIVDFKPSQQAGTLVHWLRKNEQVNKVTLFDHETPNALRCELSFRIIEMKQGLHLLEILPVTGRPHQIRAQLADIGCPIFGDLKYGSSHALGKSICLHARQLQFIHPVKKEETIIIADPPASEFLEPVLAILTFVYELVTKTSGALEVAISMASDSDTDCFACTGTTVVYIAKPILNWCFAPDSVPVWGRIIYYILILPVYNLILLAYGFVFGQFKFFYEFEKRFLKRIFSKFGSQ